MNQRSVAYYRSLPYTRRARPEQDASGDAYFVAWVEEIQWIRADGPSREEALHRLDEAFGEAIEMMIAAGDAIVEPPQWPESVGQPGERGRRLTLRRSIERATTSEGQTIAAASQREWEALGSTEAPKTAGVGV
jgi:predicted RNase H-like HicB family nuclease